MSDNVVDNSYDFDTLLEYVKTMKRDIGDLQKTLEQVRDNTALLSEIKDYLYEMKNK